MRERQVKRETDIEMERVNWRKIKREIELKKNERKRERQ